MHKKYNTLLKTKRCTVGRTNDRKTSHLSKNDCENVTKNELYTPENFYKINADQNSDNLFIHINISISYHIDDLNAFINNFKIKSKVIGLTETRLRKNRQPLSNINLENYVYESIPTESSKGGTMLHVDKQLRYRLRKDLMIYKSKEIESMLIEFFNNNNSNTVIGCIYKHPKVPVTKFMEDYLVLLLEKLAKEKKETSLMGDFNINILNCNSDRDKSSFIDTVCSNSFYPTMNIPTQITSTSKTLIDNILYNTITKSISAGNIVISISDHLMQYIFIPSEISAKPNNNKIFKRKYTAAENLKKI